VAVVFLDSRFDVFDVECSLGAAAPISLPSDADEVGVDGAGVALGVTDDESAAAGPAPDRALQVVVVGAALLARIVLGFEDPLISWTSSRSAGDASRTHEV
jgi:hypothetical protein